MIAYARHILARAARMLREMLGEPSRLRDELVRLQAQIARDTPNNPASFGYKIYSQCDEDGIIAHLFERLGHGGRIFVEIGCGDGLENNTHALLLKGWRGVWMDADAAKISAISSSLPKSAHLHLQQVFVTSANAPLLLTAALAAISAQSLDFLSVDIDGDDLGVLTALLDGPIKPRTVCVEYNAKFPPPMKIAINPNRADGWTGDDYHGASLAALTESLTALGYRLVACNASGVNAFFVREQDMLCFPEHSIELLYQPARHHLRRLQSGHPASLKFLVDHLTQSQSAPIPDDSR